MPTRLEPCRLYVVLIPFQASSDTLFYSPSRNRDGFFPRAHPGFDGTPRLSSQLRTRQTRHRVATVVLREALHLSHGRPFVRRGVGQGDRRPSPDPPIPSFGRNLHEAGLYETGDRAPDAIPGLGRSSNPELEARLVSCRSSLLFPLLWPPPEPPSSTGHAQCCHYHRKQDLVLRNHYLANMSLLSTKDGPTRRRIV